MWTVAGMCCLGLSLFCFFFKQKTAYEIKECDWSSDVCSSDLSAFAAYFAGHARDFRGERAQLLDHRVQSFFELQNLTPNVHSNLAGKVTAGDCGGHFRDVAHLAGQVAGHEVHVVG